MVLHRPVELARLLGTWLVAERKFQVLGSNFRAMLRRYVTRQIRSNPSAPLIIYSDKY